MMIRFKKNAALCWLYISELNPESKTYVKNDEQSFTQIELVPMSAGCTFDMAARFDRELSDPDILYDFDYDDMECELHFGDEGWVELRLDVYKCGKDVDEVNDVRSIYVYLTKDEENELRRMLKELEEE